MSSHEHAKPHRPLNPAEPALLGLSDILRGVGTRYQHLQQELIQACPGSGSRGIASKRPDAGLDDRINALAVDVKALLAEGGDLIEELHSITIDMLFAGPKE